MPTHYIFDDEDNLLVASRGIHQHDPAYDGDTDTESEAEQADAEASRWRGRHPQRWKRTVTSKDYNSGKRKKLNGQIVPRRVKGKPIPSILALHFYIAHSSTRGTSFTVF